MSASEPAPHWDLPTIVRELREARESWRHRSSRDRDSSVPLARVRNHRPA